MPNRSLLHILGLLACASIVCAITEDSDGMVFDRFQFHFGLQGQLNQTTEAENKSSVPDNSTVRTTSAEAQILTEALLCPIAPRCPRVPERFYKPDGSCNNLLNGARGQADRPHKRLVPANYADGKGEPRIGVTGNQLPSTRFVSVGMQDRATRKSDKHTHMVVLWCQYLAHDITDTPTISRPPRDGPECLCGNRDPACFNIPVPLNDRQYIEEGKTCLPVVRSEAVPDAQCNTDIRQQKNTITPYIDAGTVYGNSDFQLDQLLLRRSPKLKNSKLEPHGNAPPNAISLPLVGRVRRSLRRHVDCPADVHRPSGTETCFVAGDERVNENPALASLHTLFLRMHNRVVDKLSSLNPTWRRDQLVKNGRMIVAAVTQRITYKQYLPELLGDDYMRRFGLSAVDQGYYYGYDSSYDATTANGFSTAALRFGHTLVTSPLSRTSGVWGTQGSSLHFRNNFFSTIPLLNTTHGGANSIIRGLCDDAAEVTDSTFVDDIHNFLFAPNGMLGSDLLAINLQRGRDHGLPGYNTYRQFCGLKRARRFSDFKEIPSDLRNRLENLYNGEVDDVDLYIAGISETPERGALFGPTFSCILAYQFRDFRKGDRLWHENGGDFAVFTPDQLASIREYTFSRLLCDDLQDTSSIQPNPFQQNTEDGNRRRVCDTYAPLNLEPWRVGSPEDLNTETSAESTAWFPANYNGQALTPQELLKYLLVTRPDDVCEQAVSFNGRSVNGHRQYKYDCPPGSIKATDYPNVDASKGVWSAWADSSTPNRRREGNDDETSKVTPPPCENPLAIQVFTTDGMPARETDDVFRVLSPSDGFLCMGNDQESGNCQDYKVRYFCKSYV